MALATMQVFDQEYLDRPGALVGVRKELELQHRCQHACVAAFRGAFWSQRQASGPRELCVVRSATSPTLVCACVASRDVPARPASYQCCVRVMGCARVGAASPSGRAAVVRPAAGRSPRR